MRSSATAAAEAAEADQSRAMYELCALLLTVLRAWPEEGGGRGAAAWPGQVTAAGLASMLLGPSVALMLFGSVTFMLGFFLMPWVIGLACVFLLVGFVTNLSVIWRAILWPASCSSSPKVASTSRSESSVYLLISEPENG
ncbi:hypothetical protein OsJ_29949 [Oryza sativa Japonica Group]|uniref:Uncharacterized protein n=1 Tax=Oryza sativa subsp. japonica TaxID=39947 RepID=B9G4G9_ORYSJ|nr:hypothetical protein OsJ_29949 [Oryza sativa Japonica Group]